MQYIVLEDACFSVDGDRVLKYQAGDVIEPTSDSERLCLQQLCLQNVVQQLLDRSSSKEPIEHE